MQRLLLAVAAIALAGNAVAQDVKIVTPDELKWFENPAVAAAGALITGDPTKDGSIVMLRIMLAPNTVIPPHTHPYDEIITILSGNLIFGVGDKIDPSAAELKAGSVIFNPAKTPHYIKNGQELSVIQTQFVAPGGMDYVNPADDPRTK